VVKKDGGKEAKNYLCEKVGLCFSFYYDQAKSCQNNLKVFDVILVFRVLVSLECSSTQNCKTQILWQRSIRLCCMVLRLLCENKTNKYINIKNYPNEAV
jgi:hypothetical protein